MDTMWKPTTKYIVGVGLFLLFIYLVYLSWSIITLVIIGALIAFLVRPIIIFFHTKLKIPRRLAILITYLLVVIVVMLTPLILIPQIINSFNIIVSIDYQQLISDGLTWLEKTLLDIKTNGLYIFKFQIDTARLVDPVLAYLQNVTPRISPQLPSYQVILDSLISAFSFSYGVAKSVIGTVFSVIVALIVIIISSMYFSLDAYRFYKGFLEIVPKSYRPEVSELIGKISNLWYWFLRGEFILMVIIFFMVWVSGMILGLPGAFPLALIAGVLEIIPNVGPIIASIPAVFVALIQGSLYWNVENWVFALIVIGVYTLIQQLEGYIIVPKVMGDAVKLHPLIIMFGVLVGFTTFGILGALFAAPVIASGKILIRYLIDKILGEKPFVDDEEPELTDSSIQVMMSVRTNIAKLFTRRDLRKGDGANNKIQENVDQPGVQESGDITIPK